MASRSRRSLLTIGLGISATMAGCTSNLGERLNGESSTDESTTMTLSLVSQDDDPEPVAFEIDVVDDQLTETNVPTLDIAVENTSDERVWWTQADEEFVYPGTIVEPDDVRIGLTEEITGRLVGTDGCAQVEHMERETESVTTELDPGDSFEQRYGIVGSYHALNGSCPSRETYRTEYDYGYFGEWGFEFQLE